MKKQVLSFFVFNFEEILRSVFALPAQIFQQQVQLSPAIDRDAPLDAQGVAFRQKVHVDAGELLQGLRLALLIAEVYRHLSAFVAQQVMPGGKVRHRLRRKVCLRHRGLGPGGGGQGQAGQCHPVQAEQDGKNAEPVKQAGPQFAHGGVSFPMRPVPARAGASVRQYCRFELWINIFYGWMLYFAGQNVVY